MTNITCELRPTQVEFLDTDIWLMLTSVALRRPEHPALHWSSPGLDRSWTYAQFCDDVESVAAGLFRRGVRRGSPVAIHLENSPAFLMLWFACARLGAVAVDVNAKYSYDELEHTFSLIHPVGVVTNSIAVVDAANTAGWSHFVDSEIGTVDDLFDNRDILPADDADPDAPVCIQFTSGSTDRPKAVVYTHANALWAARESASHWRLRPDDVQLIFAPLFHTLALFWQTLSTMSVGGTIVLQAKFSASRFWEVSTRYRCTRSAYLPLIRHIFGNEPVPPHDFRSWISGAQEPELAGHFKVTLFSGWGMTETVTQPIFGHTGDGTGDGAIGRVAHGYEVRIERDDGTPVVPGEAGDLLIRGVRGLSIFCEYFADPEATSQAFDANGFFRTGDRVRLLASGSIEFVDRSKDMLKVGGENVAASEIERVVRSVPGVLDAAAVARPDALLGQVPVVFVLPLEARDTDLLTSHVVAKCELLLADFKVPRSVFFVNDFPRAINKVHKARLRETLRRLDADGRTGGLVEGASSYGDITPSV